MNQIPNFPHVDATDRPDGSIEVKVLGVSRVFEGGEARADALRYMHSLAAGEDLNRPIRVHTHFGDRDSTLIIEPDGDFYDERNPADRFPISSQVGSPSSHETLNGATSGTDVLVDSPAHFGTAEHHSQPGRRVATADAGPAGNPTPPSALATEPPVPVGTRLQQRKSFIADGPVIEPARQGWRGLLNRAGARLTPGPAERAWREDVSLVSQHWPGPRTVSIGNPKGSANKTPTTAMLSAVFARYGGAGVLAWDNNETRGSLAWRTQRANHESTVLDLLPKVTDLLSTAAQSAEMSYFAHHQPKDKYDVLRSDQSTEGDHEVSGADVDAIHRVAGRYYRMIVMDSGNNERAANWRAMIERANVLVVPCTNVEDTAEAGARMLEALAARDDHSRELAENAVVIVSRRTPADDDNMTRIIDGFKPMVREVVTIPYDKALVSGVIHFDALKPQTQRAWLRAAAAVARGL